MVSLKQRKRLSLSTFSPVDSFQSRPKIEIRGQI